MTDLTKVVVEELVNQFGARCTELLTIRSERRWQLANGDVGMLAGTEHVRQSEWKVDPPTEDFLERRVELIGGANRSELINGLNAGAKSYIADLWNFTAQDTWSILRAHKSLVGAANRSLVYLDPLEGRVRIKPNSPTRLMVSPRSLYVFEPSFAVDGEHVPAGLFDVAMFVVACGKELVERQGGVHLYLRDVQGHLEARLWVRILEHLEERLDLTRGMIRATIMLDTVPGALEADEILFEMMHHAGGLAIDPQGYTADLLALFNKAEAPPMPDRETIGMNAPFLRSLSLMTIGICHRRGCHAMGATSFVLPARTQGQVKTEYLEMLADKEREAVDGHDGTLVVHEDMVNASMVEFNKSMPRAHQMHYLREDVISPKDLTAGPNGPITVESVKSILRTTLRSLMAENGRGWVIQGGRVHDRSSILLAMRILWQWNHHKQGVITTTKMPLNIDLIKFMLRKEADKMFEMSDPTIKQRVDKAMAYILEIVANDALPIL
ncbi:MAG: hypothetical protein IPO87_08710 [Flavobacteriales bacterium]|nr:hypothetical protein [Flavobacteriales bacterium]